MTEFNPQIADLLHRITLIAQDIQGRPGVGPYEVGVLQHLAEISDEISGARQERERAAVAHRYHRSPARAIDMPPTSQLDTLRARYRSAASARSGWPSFTAIRSQIPGGAPHSLLSWIHQDEIHLEPYLPRHGDETPDL